jgi:uncharacterized protein YdeI (YjbR/CyaY-like superfamily)
MGGLLSVAERKTVRVKSAAELHRWFEKNHASSPGVWMVINKKDTPRPGVYYEEAVEEALCFGWIDGRLNPLDGDRYRLLFSPRKPGGTWAKSNKERVARLIEQGRMTAAGLAKIEAAKHDGSWDTLDVLDNLEIPPDLERALSENRAARKTYESWTDSYKTRVIYWIVSAKRAETRSKRVTQTVSAASENSKPFQ